MCRRGQNGIALIPGGKYYKINIIKNITKLKNNFYDLDLDELE